MSTNLWYSKHHSISIVLEYSLTMFYPYLHSTKNSFLTFINQPCCFIRWPTFLPPRHQPKTGPQRSAPIARSWIRWGDLSLKISRFSNSSALKDAGLWRTQKHGGLRWFLHIFRQWWGQLRPREDVSGHVGTSLFKKPLKKAKYHWTGKVCLVHEIIIFSCRTVF